MSDIAVHSVGEEGARPVRVVPRERPIIGPLPLLMMGGLALSSLVIAVYGSWMGYGQPRVTSSPLVESRDLSFLPVGEQGMTAIEARTGRVVEELRLAKGDGFVLQVIRGLNNDRKVAGRDLTAPYRLSLHADGRSYMTDPATGKFIATASFGPAQAAHVAALIDKAVKVAGERP